MRTLSYTELPRTNGPRQVFTVDMTIDGAALHARVKPRYYVGTIQWRNHCSRFVCYSIICSGNDSLCTDWLKAWE